jgi:hypothetical protein
MSRTKRNSGKFSEVLRSVTPYKRQQRRKLLRDFEQEYIGHNKDPMIEL